MKYFIYSRTQHKEQNVIGESINKKYTPGKVYTKGMYKLYTEILNVPTGRYSDGKVVFSTENNSLTGVNYTDASYETR